MNSCLKTLHEILLAQHSALAEKLGDETDPAKAGAILTEMQEILHRIDVVQGLLFRETANALEDSVNKIKAADNKLTQAIQSVDNIASFVKSVSDFLSLVDTAIDIAKTLAPLAAGV